MTKTEALERLRATIAEYTDMGMHDRAAELAKQLPALEQESNAERGLLRAAVGGPLAALGDAATAAGPGKPAQWHEDMSPERRARRAELNPLLGAADALAEKQRTERDKR